MSLLKSILSPIRTYLFKRFVEDPVLAETKEQADRIVSTLKRLEERDLHWADLVEDHPSPWQIPERTAVGQALSNVLLWSFRSAMLERPDMPYLEIKLPGADTSGQHIVVTIQRVAGPTPHDLQRVASLATGILAENLLQYGKHQHGCRPMRGLECSCGFKPAEFHAKRFLEERKAHG